MIGFFYQVIGKIWTVLGRNIPYLVRLGLNITIIVYLVDVLQKRIGCFFISNLSLVCRNTHNGVFVVLSMTILVYSDQILFKRIALFFRNGSYWDVIHPTESVWT